MSVLRDAPVNWSWASGLLTLSISTVFAGLPWLNAAYWTLAIELQFYVLIVLLPRILGASTLALAAGRVCLLLAKIARCLQTLSTRPVQPSRSPHLPVFAVGVVTFYAQRQAVEAGILVDAGSRVGTGLLFTRDLVVMLACQRCCLQSRSPPCADAERRRAGLARCDFMLNLPAAFPYWR